MTQTIDLVTVLASHVGVEQMAKLRNFARWVKLAHPTTTLHVAGSAMRTKAFRDIDLWMAYTPQEYDEKYKRGYDGQVELWWFNCAAYSKLGSEQTGLPIDFHITTTEGLKALGSTILELA